MKTNMGRRGFLGLGAALGAALAASNVQRFGIGLKQARADGPGPLPKLLFVVAATGGGSIIDSFLPVAMSEVSSRDKANTLLTYDDAALTTVPGSNLRCVSNLRRTGPFPNEYDLSDFLKLHGQDAAVVTQECTSVNHVVAQKRALTGAGINAGRTIMEAVAAKHGGGLLLPNCNFASGAFVERGDDRTLPNTAVGQVISNPLFFALATSGRRGIKGAPSAADLERARGTRAKLEGVSDFGQRYANADRIRRYQELRTDTSPKLEGADLITRLMLLPSTPEYPLTDYELSSSPDAALVMSQFPDLNKGDTLAAQAAVAFLLALYGMSCALTIGHGQPNFVDKKIIDTPLAFDYSHTDHLTGQNVMWGRTMKVVSGLVSLLKAKDLWSRSLVFVATDFGRTKSRPAGSTTFGTGHEQSNGNLLVSPLIKGNRVYGGVDPETCRTYGFDPASGAPKKDTVMREGHVYSAVAQALGVEFSGRHDLPCIVR